MQQPVPGLEPEFEQLVATREPPGLVQVSAVPKLEVKLLVSPLTATMLALLQQSWQLRSPPES